MRAPAFAVVAALLAAPPARAQVADVLRNTLEGRTVVVKIDMPATNLGVDVWPDREPPVDAAELARRKAEDGIAIPQGASYTVSKIDVSPKQIELLLGWGGAPLDKEQQLPDMGSRLKIHYEDGVPSEALTQQGFASVVAAFLDLSTPMRTGLGEAGDADPGAVDAALGSLRPGLTRAEVEALLGRPFETLRRQEGGRPVSALSFRTPSATLQAVFEGNRLLRWSLEPR